MFRLCLFFPFILRCFFFLLLHSLILLGSLIDIAKALSVLVFFSLSFCVQFTVAVTIAVCIFFSSGQCFLWRYTRYFFWIEVLCTNIQNELNDVNIYIYTFAFLHMKTKSQRKLKKFWNVMCFFLSSPSSSVALSFRFLFAVGWMLSVQQNKLCEKQYSIRKAAVVLRFIRYLICHCCTCLCMCMLFFSRVCGL